MSHTNIQQDSNSSESTFSIDLEQLLSQGHTIKIKPQGTSMYPLFHPGRDEACIEQVPFSSVKRGDVILYRRDNSILVLHRIWKVKDNSLYMIGDNQTQIEGPLRADQLRGKLVGVVRNGHFIDIKNPLYRFLSGLWLFMRPVRPVVWKLTATFRRLFHH